MKSKILLAAAIFMVFSVVAKAQRFNPDVMEEHLKGPVKSVLTTVRTPQGRVVGHPVRNNFNENGYFTQNMYYDTIGNPVIIVSYVYDSKDRLVKDIRTHEPYSELLSQTTYVYNKKEKTITAEMFGIADSLEESNVYRFDKNNFLQSVATLDANGKEVALIKYEYSENCKYPQFVTYTEGENAIYKGTEKFRYDTEGFLAEKCSYYLTTLRQAFLYTYYYDEYGNWTQAYVYHVTPSEGYLYQVITRQISYFD
ncbi:MAG: hypothetical protein K5842_08640 [Bacteroidales bacterium]|nr:hypothetical protein [Bacteroidales bacterium]